MSKGKLSFRGCLVFIAGVFVASFVGWLPRGQSELAKFNDTGQIVSLVGVVDESPRMTEKTQQLRFQVQFSENSSQKERLLVITSRYPSYRYGDKVKIEGKLETPESFARFDYQGWLAKDHIYSQALFPKIELSDYGQGNRLKTALFNFKEKFSETWQRFLSPPHLGIFEALVFGEEQNIPRDWKDKLNFSGTRHLTAVSGMNITIISGLLVSLLLALGFWRAQAMLLSLVLIWLYIMMIGLPSSALRAGLMISLVFLAQGFGRQSSTERALVLAAAILLLENPLILRYDPGFQLSFLAMTGLIFWQPFFEEKVFQKWPDFWRDSLSTVFSAQVFTLPLIAFNFGYLSLVSPLTNLALVSLVPYLTMAGFVLGTLVTIMPFLGQFVSWFFWLATNFILLVVDWSLRIPFAFLRVENTSVLLLVISYLLLVFLTWRIRESQKLKFLEY
jgi:competence protein ComEC